MRRSFALIILTLALAGCENGKPDDESAVRKTAKDLNEAYNRHEPDKIAALWAEDGVLFHPLTGETSTGRQEILDYYKKEFAKNKDSKADVAVDSVDFEGPDNATIKGFLRVYTKEEPPTQSAFRAQLELEKGKWVFQDITDINLEPAPSNFEHLKPIDWLVGDWTDKDENTEINFNLKWDKYKNFLIQRFTSKVLGQEQIEGQQIIGWDPVKKKIRSWVFDSDGGYGEGFWDNKDKSLFANMIYTLPDGRKASATLIYTKIDDRSYTFSAVGRDVDGEILPDIEPVVVEKNDKK